MPIELPELDDKTHADLVEEARAAIPGIYPGWTDHNFHDLDNNDSGLNGYQCHFRTDVCL